MGLDQRLLLRFRYALLVALGEDGFRSDAVRPDAIGADLRGELPHAGILRAIGASPGLSQQALSTMLGILPSRLVSLLDELEGRGLLERRNHPDDRRTYALHLTENGSRTLEAIGRLAREHGDSLCAALNEKEREQLTSLLRRIAEQQGLAAGVHPGFRRL